MSTFSWVGAVAKTPPANNAVNFTFAPPDPTKVKIPGADLFSNGSVSGFSTFPAGTATTVLNLSTGIGEYSSYTALAGNLRPSEYISQVVLAGNLVPSEYTSELVSINLGTAIREFPEVAFSGNDVFSTAAPGWPVVFRSDELGVPKSVSLVGYNLFNTGVWSHLGVSNLLFGGCGFGFGDSFVVEPSYWDDEQAYFVSSVFTSGVDNFVNGGVSVV